VATGHFAIPIGSAANAAVGVLFAPHSGEDPRSYLRDIAQDSAGEAISHGYTVVRRVSKTVDDAKAFVSDIADTAGRRLLRGAT
jgi:hypothetical protein